MYFSKVYFICEPGIEVWPILGGCRWAYLLTSDNLWPHVAFSWRPHEQESMWFTAWRDYAQIFCSKNFYRSVLTLTVADIFTQMTLNCLRFWRGPLICPWPIKKSVCLELICLFVFGLGLVCLFVCFWPWWSEEGPARPPTSTVALKQTNHQHPQLISINDITPQCSFICLVLPVCLFLVFIS